MFRTLLSLQCICHWSLWMSSPLYSVHICDV